MSIWHAIILGVIQGITEFLPISSTGHLVLAQKLLGISDGNLVFVTLLHLGTLLAVIWALRRDVYDLIRHPLGRRVRMVIFALLPTAAIGAVFEDWFDGLVKSGVTIGLEFVVTGVILWWMDSLSEGGKDEDRMRVSDALWIGVFQGAALMPALSRSGLTIAGGLWRGMNRKAAGRFSFLVSIPAILGAVALELIHGLDGTATSEAVGVSAMVFGTLAAAVSGYFAVHGTLWFLERCKMRIFAVYVWGVAAFILFDQLFTHHWFPPFHS